ncbi:peptidase domain-containing ABC transporter [Defluviicoccus vanus]|uniref:Peptidase domain-containing ABC transporter n=1 Tax=Defluviicoccus vanus TaxID=111831 RepID=A0A7H1N037_9PROT|nr:peptidase domain-containing ABC transporter [Defluviicoccus vanus]QNT69073.1 peptidase domain-containing ABC transporter [Defluviicoccus vanus]
MANTVSRTWIRDLLRPLLPVFGEVALWSLFVNLLALAVPVFVMQVYDRVIFHNGLNTLVALLLGMLLVLIFDFVLRQARARILQRVALRIDADLGRALFGRLVRLPLHQVERRSTASWHALFRDVDTIRNALSGSTALTLCDSLFFILFLALTFFIAQPIAWILVVATPVFALVAWRSGHVVKLSSERERSLAVARDTLVAEIIAGRATVQALALEQTLQPLWEERHAAALGQSICRGAAADRYAALGSSLTLLTTVAMTAIGALCVLDQKLTLGALIAANMLGGRLIAPITQIGLNWRTIASLREVSERLSSLFAVPLQRQENGLVSVTPLGRITVEHVTFAHDIAAAPTLDTLDISIPAVAAAGAGGMHAIVGRNGSGKSTLLKIITGLYQPANGRVLIDGSDIAQYSRRQLARWIGYVPQETVLFAGTLRHNIALRVPEASDDDVIRAATLAGAHAFIALRPEGYATDAGEAGLRLSAGQRQRVAIARALVGEPPILVLDEPSNALDTQADADLRVRLAELAKTTTIIIVTHHLAWLSLCTSIAVLDQGRIVDSGDAATILPKLGHRGRTDLHSRAAGSVNVTPQSYARPNPAGRGPVELVKMGSLVTTPRHTPSGGR